MSFAKRIQNEVTEYEKASDRKVPHDSYFIIEVVFDDDTIEKKEKLIKLLFTEPETYGRPCLIYFTSSILYLLYSCLEDNSSSSVEHFCGGSHTGLASQFCYHLYQHTGKRVKVRIIELDTRIKVLTYLFWKCHEYTRLYVSLLTNINKKETLSMTLSELSIRVKNWNDIAPSEKYGCFYRINEKGKLATLSEALNFQEMEKSSAFFFS